ncbi:coiled-coil domain-containing protein 158-like [Aplochiton taeniatus]
MSFEPLSSVPKTKSSANSNGTQWLPIRIETNCNNATVNLLEPLSSTQRFHNLDNLSEELERQTKATQILQEEVDIATKVAMESASHTYGINSTPSQISHLLQMFKKGTLVCIDTLIITVFPWLYFTDDSPHTNSDIFTTSQQSVIQPRACLDSIDLVVARGGVFFPGKDVLENAISDYSHQVSELQRQLSESHVQHEQQKFHFRQSIIKLQTKLQEVQIERDALSDLRLKESKTQTDLMGKMQGVMRELQSTKWSGDHKLQEAEENAMALKSKAESMEHTIQEVYSILRTHEKQCGGISPVSQDTAANTSHVPLGLAVKKILQDLEDVNRSLQGNMFFPQLEEQFKSHQNKWKVKEEITMKEHHEGIEKLMTSYHQEVALLTEKLSTSRSNTASLKVKVELLQNHAQSQASVHDCQVRELESTISILRSDLMNGQCINEDKVATLEQQLSQAQSQVEEAQNGRKRSLKQAEGLSSQLSNLTLELHQAREELAEEKDQNKRLRECATGHDSTIEEQRRELEQRSRGIQQLESLVGSLKENCKAEMEAQLCSEEQQCLLQEEVEACRRELEATREQLQRAQAEGGVMQALLEEREEEGNKAQVYREELELELRLRQQEAQQARGRLEEAQGHCQGLRAEAEVLRLKLDDREKMAEILRLQMESDGQAAVQHGRTIDSLHQENGCLSSQLQQHKLQIQHLQTDLSQREADLIGLQRERGRLQVDQDELSCSVQTLTLEKQQLTAELEVQRMQLARLAEEQEELKRAHNSRNEEWEGVVSKLRTQLKTTRTELDQTTSTLRSLNGADGHGMQVAMGMQKTITAKREQIDSLQGRIQTLEETMEKLSQEKRRQCLESKRQDQELTSVREEKRQLAAQVETRRSMERQLRDQVTDLEKSLHKMSESFADCQDFIQLQEQETARLKLEHALDLKELQGHYRRTTGSTLQRSPASSSPATTTALAHTLQASKCLIEAQQLQESPTLELRSLVKELQGVISENPRPHTISISGMSSYRRRSAPERVYGTTYKLKEETKWLGSSAKVTKEVHSSSESLLPSVGTDLDEKNLNSTFLSESRNSSLGPCMPFYTSSPYPLAQGGRSPVHSLLTSETYPSHLSLHRIETASPIPEMSSFIKGQERKMSYVKEKGKLYNMHDTE